MNFSGNDFQFGQDRVKKLLWAAVIVCVLALIAGNFNVMLQSILLIATLLIIGWTFVTIFRYCKCPHCGKVILFGILQASTCPKCRRSLVSGKKTKKSKR